MTFDGLYEMLNPHVEVVIVDDLDGKQTSNEIEKSDYWVARLGIRDGARLLKR